ncbi:MAG: hypothetical protein JKX73_11675, partial [Flavobacteriales bacterium]|nr:hypothetical protein [Flavobacteriales bacterium]
MNDDQLDIYFKEARRALSEPEPIDNIRGKIQSAKGGSGSMFWRQRRFQVILVIAIAFLGFYFFEDFRSSDNETVTEEEINQVEAEENETLQSTEQESTNEDATQEVADVDQQEILVEEVLPKQEDEATSSVQN